MKRGGISTQIREFSGGLRKNVDRVMRTALTSFATEVVVNSPVRTGHFAYNWRFSSVGQPQGVLEGTDPGKGRVLGRLRSDISRYASTGKTAYFANNVDYALSIEYGSSRQAPSGVLRNAIARWPGFVRSAVAANRGKRR